MSRDSKLVKLVRDRILSYIGRDAVVEYKPVSYQELPTLLENKLIEEALEYIRDPCDEELADIYEVVRALAHHRHGGIDYIVAAAKVKFEERGGFIDGVGLYATKVDP